MRRRRGFEWNRRTECHVGPYPLGCGSARVRVRAPYDEAYREQFADTDASLREHVAEVVRDGIETGVFREVDPERTAAFIAATIHGAQSQYVTTGSDEPLEAARRELTEYVRTHLDADGEADG